MKQRIHFNEVVTRDGFQMEPEFVPTDSKVALINALSHCGYAKIEVTSFTSAKAIPMLRDAEEVMGRIERVPGVEYTVLVPNLRGAERAMESRPDEFNLVMSTSETHNLANLRMPREHSFAALRDVVARPAGPDQCVFVGLFWLSDGGRCAASRGAAVGAAFCRSGRAGPHDLRHHRYGPSRAGGTHV